MPQCRSTGAQEQTLELARRARVWSSSAGRSRPLLAWLGKKAWPDAQHHDEPAGIKQQPSSPAPPLHLSQHLGEPVKAHVDNVSAHQRQLSSGCTCPAASKLCDLTLIRSAACSCTTYA